MAEYICREAIIDDLEKEIEAGNVALDEDVWINKGLRIAIRDIKDIKTADVQPIRRGRWLQHGKADDYLWCCSACKKFIIYAEHDLYKHHFCGNCGARMDGEQNDH